MATDQATRVITAEVIAVIPEYHQAIVTDGGMQYSIGRKVPNFDWSSLKEGDMVELLVYSNIPIVKEVLNVNKN